MGREINTLGSKANHAEIQRLVVEMKDELERIKEQVLNVLVMKGKLFIFSAPSGSGKSTIVQHLMKQDLGLEFSISATSRKPREGEMDGREYHFISPEEFRTKSKQNAFIEWEEVYPDQYYGTLSQ